LCSVIANLELKMNRRCIPENHLQRLREISFFVDDMANIRHNNREPFVGDSAFAHKGGMHVDAVKKNPRTFEHIVPSRVGNRRRILLSDLSGKDNLIFKASELGLTITKKSDIVNFLSVIKERE